MDLMNWRSGATGSMQSWITAKLLYQSLASLARSRGCIPSQLGFDWVLSRAADVVPIPGKSMEHLADHLGISVCFSSFTGIVRAISIFSLPCPFAGRYLIVAGF